MFAVSFQPVVLLCLSAHASAQAVELERAVQREVTWQDQGVVNSIRMVRTLPHQLRSPDGTVTRGAL